MADISTGRSQDIGHSEISSSVKIEMQNSVISQVERGEKTLDTTQEKGNYGEMKTDQVLREQGYSRISNETVTSLQDTVRKGIDGVYENVDGKPPILIVDSKYGTAQLSETLDGKQMSENWINERLDESVGKEKADEIRKAEILNVGNYVCHVGTDSGTTFDKLDKNATVTERNVKFND